ncbi:NAD-dependent epimerase/dehydratase family protein [Acidithiobacillus thiooxidans]|nr:NAD-dependent epimerase/dehydratase family protein [Acidithiobacillus thiooxidans]
MRVFITGATGFIGTAVARELKENGHTVVGLARTSAKAVALRRQGIEPHQGDLDDLDSLRAAARGSDGVIHLAFMHGLSLSCMDYLVSLGVAACIYWLAAHRIESYSAFSKSSVTPTGAPLMR